MVYVDSFFISRISKYLFYRPNEKMTTAIDVNATNGTSSPRPENCLNHLFKDKKKFVSLAVNCISSFWMMMLMKE